MTGRESRTPWWRPDRFAGRRPTLQARAAIAAALRQWFAGQGFIEVETPVLQVSPGLEPHIRPFVTQIEAPFDQGTRRMYLQSSPEYAMKKLLAAGETKIFQLARVFRNGERGATHEPEFTMLEWYRAGAGWEQLGTDCEGILRAALAAVDPGLSRGSLRWQDRAVDPAAAFERLSVAEAFSRHAGIDLLATTPDPQRPDLGQLARRAAEIGIRTSPQDSWDDIVFRILLDRIEPHLGAARPTLLHSWPASMAALARLDPHDSRVAERCELYVAGLELANGFGELTDAAEQRRRFALEQAQKRDLLGDDVPLDDDFLAALDHGLPPSAGMAMGFDRLVMLATGATEIQQVLWAPVA